MDYEKYRECDIILNKLLDVLALGRSLSIIVISYPFYGDHVNYMMFVFLAAISYTPWVGCMIAGGSPARWWPIFTNVYITCAMAAFGILLPVLVTLIAILGEFDTWMLPMVGASILVVYRVSMPLTICAVCWSLRIAKPIPV